MLQELIKSFKYKDAVREMVKHDSRMQFFINPQLDSFCSDYLTEFLNKISKILTKDKFLRFKYYLNSPYPTVSLSKTIFDELFKIFSGINPHFEVICNPNIKDAANEILKTNHQLFKTKGWNVYKNNPNAVMVATPEKILFIYAKDIVYFNDNFSIFIYKEGENFVYIDSEKYEILDKDEKVLNTIPHQLGYTPVRQFLSTNLTGLSDYVKATNLSNSLSLFENLLFVSTNYDYAKNYLAHPILINYSIECDYRDEPHNLYCSAGFLKTIDTNTYTYYSNELAKCPQCSSSRFIGAGSNVEIPAAQEGEPDYTNFAQFVMPPIEALNEQRIEIKRLHDEIFRSCTGAEDFQTSQAINEFQVKSNYESKYNIILQLSNEFEQAEKWATETQLKLNYYNAIQAVNVDYGTEFYLKSLADLQKEYNEATTIEQKKDINNQIVLTKYRYNGEMLKRNLIIENIFPLRYYSNEQVIANELPESVKMTNIMFFDLLARFERENFPIQNFDFNSMTIENAVNYINTMFNKYLSEYDKTKNEAGAEEENDPGNDSSLSKD